MHRNPQPDPSTDPGSTLREYRATWTIDIDATSPADAARLALAALRRRGSTATVLDVQWTETVHHAPPIELTSRMRVDLDSRQQTAALATPPPALPGITIDVLRAAAWLAEPSEDNPARTNAQSCELVGNEPPACEDVCFYAQVHVLLIAANGAQLFGPHVDMRLGFTMSDDGDVEGAMLIANIHSPDQRRQPVRLTSEQLRREDLVWQTGYPVALGVLRCVVALANRTLTALRDHLAVHEAR